MSNTKSSIPGDTEWAFVNHLDLEAGEDPFSYDRACEFALDVEGSVSLVRGKIDGRTPTGLMVAPFDDNGQPDYSSMWDVPVGRVTKTWGW